jgi:hypothetical protein
MAQVAAMHTGIFAFQGKNVREGKPGDFLTPGEDGAIRTPCCLLVEAFRTSTFKPYGAQNDGKTFAPVLIALQKATRHLVGELPDSGISIA